MIDKEELQKGCGQLLKKLREEAGLSVSKMADLMLIDRRTWQNYEDGLSSPNVIDFIHMFNVLGKDALRSVLDFLYPDIYKGLDSESDLENLRSAGANYFQDVASDRFVRQWDFLVFGEHGSNIEPQMQEWVMIDHLPMYYRYAIAEQVLIYWKLAMIHNEIILTDRAMPDISLFMEGIEKGREAVKDNRNSYTTSTGRRDINGIQIS